MGGRFPPQRMMAASAILGLFVVLFQIGLATRTPWLGVAFQASGSDGPGIVVTATSTASGLRPGDRVIAFRSPGSRVEVDGGMLMEEPDMWPTYADYNAFMARQGQLNALLRQEPLTAELADGRIVPVAVAPRRPIGSLPPLFWLQLAYGVTGLMVGVGVLAFRREEIAARTYALTGLGFLLFACAAAVYSTRELALDAGLFRALSVLNHLGTFVFTGFLAALLWVYPKRLGRAPVVAVLAILLSLMWLGDTLQLFEDLATGFHLQVLALFLVSIVFAVAQWRATRALPLERAALKWFLMAIYLATGLFAVFIIIPAALNLPPPASQGLMFGAFLIMYLGLALGITRYKLFNLERWWFHAWAWFLGGVAVVLVDALLFMGLGMSNSMSLMLSLLLVGWVYFPLRQWWWGRLRPLPARRLEGELPGLVARLFSARSESTIVQTWPEVLRQTFAPLELVPMTAPLSEAQLAGDGTTLAVPAIGDGHLLLRYSANGTRLFDRDDLQLAGDMFALVRRAAEVTCAREQGAEEERGRIMRDLHDDLGARLLSLVATAGTPERERLARAAVTDLREVLVALDTGTGSLASAAEEWREELEARAREAGAEVRWHMTAPAVELSSRARANLGRVVREAVSNALRHGRADRLEARLEMDGDALQVTICDNGQGEPVTRWRPGKGQRIIRTRVGELGGSVHWAAREPHGCCMTLRVPLADNRAGVA